MLTELRARWGIWRIPAWPWVIFPTILVLGQVGAVEAQDMASFYKKNCAACHSIGGGAMVGPDLKGVLQRRDRTWLVRFLENPKAVIDSGDEYARKLVSECHGLVMPAVAGMDEAKAGALLDYIEAQSNGGAASSKKAPVEQPFPAAEVQRGNEVFLGSRPLAAGGAPCISCHTLRDLPSLGGGRLGPDLTQAYQRLGGRTGMNGWLSSPPTPTMQAAYRSHVLEAGEINSLLAYFESVSRQDSAHPSTQPARPFLTFFLIGIGGSLAGLVLLDEFWRKRFRAVRRPLVSKKKGSR